MRATIDLQSAPCASPEQAAAIAAAIERFARENTQAASTQGSEPDRWARVAILEGVQREDVLPGDWEAASIHR
jgi:hypothetical protein